VILYPKKQSHQAIMLFFVLLFFVFLFRFFEVKQNLANIPAFSSLRSQNSEEELLKRNKDEQVLSNYAEFETATLENYENEKPPHFPSDKSNDTANENKEKEFPKLLEIPKLEISAKVQYVGLNSKNEMDIPSNNDDVAWFSLGAVPGKKGSAVIAGHLDGMSGKPAIFWNLHKLEIGSDIYIIDNSGNKKHFQVVSIEKYKTGSAPMEKIFGLNNGIYLNLITCGGRWDKTKNNYSERLVVFTEHST